MNYGHKGMLLLSPTPTTSTMYLSPPCPTINVFEQIWSASVRIYFFILFNVAPAQKISGWEGNTTTINPIQNFYPTSHSFSHFMNVPFIRVE